MKRSFRSFGANVITVLYCLAIGAAIAIPRQADFSSQSQSSKKYLSSLSKSILVHISEVESSAGGFNYVPLPEFQKLLDGLGGSWRATENCLKAEFVQYSRFLLILKVRQRKTDLLFPFHFFW